jgi:uncharacterized protein
MPGLPLLDTNVILRPLLDDHPDHSPRSHRLFAAIEAGTNPVQITETIVFEAAFTLERFYRVPRNEIRDALDVLIQLPGIALTGKRSYRRVFDLWVEQPRLSFADCYHAAIVERLGLPGIISFDRGFDQLASVRRSEP